MIDLNHPFFVIRFDAYLHKVLKENNFSQLFDSLCNEFDYVCVFSGIIRNFFLGKIDYLSDLDITVCNKNSQVNDVYEILDDIDYKSNKDIKHSIVEENYGEEYTDEDYSKHKFTNTKTSFTIDIWDLKSSVGFEKKDNCIPYDNRNMWDLINTAFFNASAICYDAKKKYFYYNRYFLEFLKTNELHIVNDINCYDILQIYKVIKYYNLYNIKSGNDIIKFIYNHDYRHNYPTFSKGELSLNEVINFFQSHNCEVEEILNIINKYKKFFGIKITEFNNKFDIKDLLKSFF